MVASEDHKCLYRILFNRWDISVGTKWSLYWQRINATLKQARRPHGGISEITKIIKLHSVRAMNVQSEISHQVNSREIVDEEELTKWRLMLPCHSPD